MSPVEVDAALCRWGWVYGERPEVELPESAKSPAFHPLARAMEFAPGTTDKRKMASYQRALLPGEKTWSRDPIPCRETRQTAGSAPVAPPQNDQAEQVQRAWLVLKRERDEQAEALRIQYQTSGGQRDKADRMGASLSRYRELLAEARGWMTAVLAKV